MKIDPLQKAYTTGTEYTLSVSPVSLPTHLHIPCGSGFIKIDCRTGSVELSKDVTLDEAAAAFWKAVAQAFPHIRQQMLEGKK